MQHFFVYGTLAPGCPNEHILAPIEGMWREGTVKGTLYHEGWGAEQGYPGIVLDDAGEKVPGMLFSSEALNEHWNMLDEFEGEGYQRTSGMVALEDGSHVEAQIYSLRI